MLYRINASHRFYYLLFFLLLQVLFQDSGQLFHGF